MTRTSSQAAAAPEPTYTGSPLFDRIALLERCGGRAELLPQILASFFIEARELLRALHGANERGNLHLAEEFALTLRSAASNVGATRVAEVAGAAARDARAAAGPQLPSTLAALASELERFALASAADLEQDPTR